MIYAGTLLLVAVGTVMGTGTETEHQSADRNAESVLPSAAAPLDPFQSLTALDDQQLRMASGRGALYGVDLTGVRAVQIANAQNNSSDIDGEVYDTNVVNSDTGRISDNSITGNSGITTVFINSGNNVVLQSNVQVNVYVPTDQ